MVPLPLQPKVAKKEGNKSVIEIEALYPGYGVTLGNSLRRVLLSSLEGAAVTTAKIKNAAHEFSTISGIMEDAITLMLNLKQLRFKMFSPDPQKVFLAVKGEKKVKGGDFEVPAQLELVNPDCHIATLTQKSSQLEIEITVEKGMGFLPREARKKTEAGVGVIALDAIFTPIKRVGFRVENMRVGERTDFDKLFLEIETDGTILPEEAFSKASEVLVNHFSLFSEAFQKEVSFPETPAVKTEEEKSKKKKVKAKKPNAQKKKGKKV